MNCYSANIISSYVRGWRLSPRKSGAYHYTQALSGKFTSALRGIWSWKSKEKLLKNLLLLYEFPLSNRHRGKEVQKVTEDGQNSPLRQTEGLVLPAFRPLQIYDITLFRFQQTKQCINKYLHKSGIPHQLLHGRTLYQCRKPATSHLIGGGVQCRWGTPSHDDEGHGRWIRTQVTARYQNRHQMIGSRSLPSSRIQPVNQEDYLRDTNQLDWPGHHEQPVILQRESKC